MLTGAAIFLVSTVPLVAQSPAPAQQPAPASAAAVGETPEAAQLRKQYDEIQARLETAHRQAEETPVVKEEKTKMEAVVREAIVEEDPNLAPVLESQDKLVAELNGSNELNLPAAQQSEEFQSKFNSYKKQRDQIQAVAAKVAEKPEVVSSKQNYQGILAKEMTKVEPEVPKLIEKRAEIATRYQQLVGSNNR
jgi:hypothetical protein